MRIVLVGDRAIARVQGRMLAERLGVPHLAPGVADLERALADHTAGFVLDGFPLTVAEASALDAFLRTRCADLDVVLHVAVPDAAPTASGTPASVDALLDHYRGRVVELDATGAPDVVHERALAGLREALVAA